MEARLPDDLPARLNHALASVLPDEEEREADRAERGRFLSIQPSLMDGYHGKLYGEGPNAALSVIADTLDALTPAPDSSPRDGVGGPADRDHESVVAQGRRRFDALVWLCANGRTDGDGDTLPEGLVDTADLVTKARLPLSLTVTCDLETLLGLADAPGHVVTSLTGGRLRLTAETVRKLAAAGGSLRLLVTDDHGQVIGIGTRSRVAPDWLRDAIVAMWPESIGPGSKAAARHCDLDHHREWQDDGPTDLDNLAPVDRKCHTAKTRGEWTIRAGPEPGSRMVRHVASGWEQLHLPATRRIRLDHLTKTRTRGGADPPR